MRSTRSSKPVYLGAIAVALVLIAASATQGASNDGSHRESLYAVGDLASLGGMASGGSSINDRGWIAGFSNLPTDQTRHATLWRAGSITDLGTLGGPNSSVVWPVKNEGGLIAGIVETAQIDPLGEAWSCSFFFPGEPTGHTCLGFVWESGEMRPLPTLGGNNGFATGVNDRGQVVGWAENAVQDPTCNQPQVLQFRAVIWGPREGQIQELPPLPGDTVSAATAINDRGQVVGISGICDNAVGRSSARHAVLWEKGTVTDIGDLGGAAWHTPMAINDRGDAVGFSNLPGDHSGLDFNAHAFLWTNRKGIQDLGTLQDDSTSQALGINARGQVVGLSCGENGCRAFLWRDGYLTDLDTLHAAGFPGNLISAGDIDDAGVITGAAIDPTTGGSVAFMATPIGRRIGVGGS